MQFGIALYTALVSANISPDKANEVVLQLEREVMDKLATKDDIKKDLDSLKKDLIIVLGGFIFTGFGFLAIVQNFLK